MSDKDDTERTELRRTIARLERRVADLSTALSEAEIREAQLRRIAAMDDRKAALEELERVSVAYNRFVPSPFLKHLGKDTILDVALGNQVERMMTIFFSDIRSFTTLSEAMTPQENFNFLNSYLRRAGPIIRSHSGFIDKYIGDAIMALFPNDADDAVEAALALQREVVIYNGHRAKMKYPPVRIGVGLHTGSLMLGTIGEEERMETTVISDAVNIASRTEGMTKTLGVGILLTGATVDALREPVFELRRLGRFTAKGRRHDVEIYEAFGADEPSLREHKLETLGAFTEAMAAYVSGDLESAAPAFARIAQGHPGDLPARWYVERALSHLERNDRNVSFEVLSEK